MESEDGIVPAEIRNVSSLIRMSNKFDTSTVEKISICLERLNVRTWAEAEEYARELHHESPAARLEGLMEFFQGHDLKRSLASRLERVLLGERAGRRCPGHV